MTWIFGYGSLVWRPDFEFAERQQGTLSGWARRFWQASSDHRGTPERPGRVVTLVRDPEAVTVGMVYRLEPRPAAQIMDALDYRERGGYSREVTPITLVDGRVVDAVVYRGTPANPNYLGPAPLVELAAQIRTAVGPSGANPEYVLELHRALTRMGAPDPHVAGIAALLSSSNAPCVEAIHVAPEGKAPMEAVQQVNALAGKGLEGDRYCGRLRKGHAYPQGAITLIEGETHDALATEQGVVLAPGESRRNMTTRGVRLNELVGCRFRLGEALLEGYELCHPCRGLEELTRKPLLAALRNRGGLRAYIIEGALVAVGDPIIVP